MYWLVPLVVAVALVALLVVERVHRGTELAVSRLALALFGEYVASQSPRAESQKARIRAAHVGRTHRLYAARTLLYAGLLGVAGSIFGVYLAALVLQLLAIGSEQLQAALPSQLDFLAAVVNLSGIRGLQLFALLLVSSATVGSALALGTYSLRWLLLDQRATARATEVEATLPRTIAVVYALSRSGMSFPDVLATLTDNEAVYGEAASEVGVAVRDMNTFGTDVLTALQRLGGRTPSEGMEEFAENLSSVLGSGRNLSGFLRSQYERYQDEAESQQRQYLDLLATFAEAYVTVLVAGPLFFITILVVIGMVLQGTLPLLRAVTYVGLPLANLAFIIYIDSVTQTLHDGGGRAEATDEQGRSAASSSAAGVADGGRPVANDRWATSRERLAAYDDLERLLTWLRRPTDTVLRNPWVTALLTAPLGAVWVWFRLGSVPAEPLAALRALDHPVAEATLGAVAVYAVVYEIEKRRLNSIEAAVPDFLDRFASVNDAGMSVVGSLEQLTDTDLGDLTPEIERTWADVRWGADVETALRRMDDRIGSATMSRAITLVTNSMAASGDIAPVLEIAADEARSTQQLRRERKQEMVTYLLVIYISFLVFLGIIAALTVSFVPAIENAQIGASGGGGQVPGGISSGPFSGLGEVAVGQYTLIFFHASLVQSVCSGLVAGQLGEGTVRDGAKHAVILLTLSMVAFTLMGQP
ncbi:MAG: type II secretion system F family protein [Halolamina sp.]